MLLALFIMIRSPRFERADSWAIRRGFRQRSLHLLLRSVPVVASAGITQQACLKSQAALTALLMFSHG